MLLEDFHNRHLGQTALMVGNGPNLALTPPERFDYPSFGMNTCYKWPGPWMPSYYTGVDSRLMREHGRAIEQKYRNIPKFVPRPNLDGWPGENFYRFYFRPGPLWPRSQQRLWPSDLLSTDGISYGNVMHVAWQLAYFMGFSTLLVIGMSHKPMHGREHFWGEDTGIPYTYPVQSWFDGYKELRQGMEVQGVKILNISEDTYVAEDVIPRADWRQYAKSEILARLPG